MIKPHEQLSDIRQLQSHPDNVRNVSVIGHVGHGKSSFTDVLLSHCGAVSADAVRKRRVLDYTKEEQERGLTIQSKGITLVYNHNLNEGQPKRHLLHLVDSPGHVEFSSEVASALRITDGAVLVVDSMEGVRLRTQTVLRHALAERVKPVLVLNKLDRLIAELQDQEAVYTQLSRIIEDVNYIIRQHPDPALGDVEVDPLKGTVGFGSAAQGWAFTLPQFAGLLAEKSKHKKPASYFLSRLWGNHFFDNQTKQFSERDRSESGQSLQRFFCQAILQPIDEIFAACRASNIDRLTKMLQAIQLSMSGSEGAENPTELLPIVMQKFLPAANALLEMVTLHLPSPVAAQKYRVEILYNGPMNEECAVAIRDCNPDGPLLLHVAKMVEDNAGNYYALGRVFSGTVKAGQRLRILGPNLSPDNKADTYVQEIGEVLLVMGSDTQTIDECPCGGIVGIRSGKNIHHCVTLTTSENASYFVPMKFNAPLIIRVAVEPVSPADLSTLTEALRKLVRLDPCVQVLVTESGEHTINCAGELHLQLLLDRLRNRYCRGVKLVVSEPMVYFRETVTKESPECMAKSPNKHNRYYARALPLHRDLQDDIESGLVSPDIEERARYLQGRYGWTLNDSRRIWCFGPENEGPNMLVDATKGVDFLHEVKDYVVKAFQYSTSGGPLCEEEMRGVRINLLHVQLFFDAIHRGAGQIIPPARKVFYGSVLNAGPALLEPIYMLEMQARGMEQESISAVLSQRRGKVVDIRPLGATELIKAHLPVLESFGITEAFREMGSNPMALQCVFDHWGLVPGNPLQEDTKANVIVTQLRKHKGLGGAIPTLDYYLDKM